MSNETTPAAVLAAEPTPVLPGDVVQVTDPASPLCDCLLLVEQSYPWGVGAVLRWSERAPKESYHRVGAGAYQLVGTAPLLPARVEENRRVAIAGRAA